MEYNFRQKESYLFDALLFPEMIYFKKEDFHKSEDNYIELIPKSSIKMAIEMQDLLLPYEEQVKKFYYEENQDRSLIELLMVSNPFMGIENPLDYLKILQKKSEDELLFEAIYALDYFNQDMGKQDKDASKEIAKGLVENQENIMAWINELGIKNDAKWQLFSFMQNPTQKLEDYISLMGELIPKFEKFYEKHREKVVKFGKGFVKKLNDLEGDSLNMVSNGMISESVLQTKSIDVIISLVNSTNIMLNTASDKPFISWGYDIEKIFAMIKENQANQVMERVTFFKNLGDNTRYEVLMNIAEGVTSTKVIAKKLNLSSATISYHLNNLLTVKLIYLAQIDGKYTYKVNEEAIRKNIEGFMMDLENRS